MSVKTEERFYLSNKRWICSKLFVGEDNKVSHHDHITGKYFK